MYENFVGTLETVRNREVSVLERCPHGEVRLYLADKQQILKSRKVRNNDKQIQLSRNVYCKRVLT